MILKEESRKVKTNNVTDLGTFTIEASNKAFNILSKRIYSNPIRAIVRELSCNAYDSHVEAGKRDVPFRIKLPSSLSLSFEIEDYGVGLPHDMKTMMKIYTVYFSSTKNNTDEQIGALGLGSKTPFAYVDSFTIISRYDGVEVVYTAYKNSSGEPSIAEVNRCETDQGNGLKIMFPVKKGDIESFVNETHSILKPFPVKPLIEGYSNPIGVEECVIDEERWMLVKESTDINYYAGRRNGSAFCYIRWGNIDYPINYETIAIANIDDSLSVDGFRRIVNHRNTLIMKFPLTYKFDFEPSREALLLTKDDLVEMVKINEQIKAYAKETLRSSETTFDSIMDHMINIAETSPFKVYTATSSSDKIYVGDDAFPISDFIPALRKDLDEYGSKYTCDARMFYKHGYKDKVVKEATDLMSLAHIINYITYNSDLGDRGKRKFVYLIDDVNTSTSVNRLKTIIRKNSHLFIFLFSSVGDSFNSERIINLSDYLLENKSVWYTKSVNPNNKSLKIKDIELFGIHGDKAEQYSIWTVEEAMKVDAKYPEAVKMYAVFTSNSCTVSYRGIPRVFYRKDFSTLYSYLQSIIPDKHIILCGFTKTIFNFPKLQKYLSDNSFHPVQDLVKSTLSELEQNVDSFLKGKVRVSIDESVYSFYQWLSNLDSEFKQLFESIPSSFIHRVDRNSYYSINNDSLRMNPLTNMSAPIKNRVEQIYGYINILSSYIFKTYPLTPQNSYEFHSKIEDVREYILFKLGEELTYGKENYA